MRSGLFSLSPLWLAVTVGMLFAPFADAAEETGLLRRYGFEGPLAADRPVANLAGGAGELRYQAVPKRGAQPEAFQVVEGHRPGRKAVRLDQNVLAGEAFVPPGKAFSVEGWVRIGGVGTHRGNNESAGGALFSVGSGYWDGFRLTYSYPQRTIAFEIGRPKPSHSVGIRTGVVPDQVWHHLAATWDGTQMRVYVDGLVAAAGEFTGAWTAPARGQFRIGFANAGIGSVVLDVGEVAVWGRALAADEVLCRACSAPRLDDASGAHVRRAADCRLANDPAGAEAALAALLGAPGVSGELLCTLRIARAECLMGAHQVAAAGRELAEILAAADCPARHKADALVKLRELVRESPGSALARGTHEALLALEDLQPQELWAIRLSQAHCRFADRDFAGARTQYAKIAGAPDAPAVYRTLAQLRAAETCARMGDRGQAIREYERVANLAGAAAHHVWEAHEQAAALRRVEKGLPARDPAATRLRLPSRPAPALTLYVGPDGQDSNPGTRERPFGTLPRARDEIRRVKPAGAVVVCVRGGRYPVGKTFELSAEDSGTASAPIVYQAAAGETPVFSGALRLQGFQPVTDANVIERLPAESHARVRQVDLKRFGLQNFRPLVLGGYSNGRGFKTVPVEELYFNGTPLPMARWPNEGWAEMPDVVALDFEVRGRKGSSAGRLKYEGERPSRWLAEKDGFLYGYWFHDWADSYERIESIEPEKNQINLAPPWARYGYRPKRRYYGVNLLAEIDRPGEWYLDRQAGTLYVWPPSDPDKAVVELSVAEFPFVKMEKVGHVTLEGFRWERGAGDAVSLRDCEDCVLAGCTVEGFAGDGVVISGGQRCGLISCDIAQMGRGGARLDGGDRMTLRPSGHFVENCHIHHLSRLHHTYTPGVRVTGVACRVAHNLFHDIGSSAINLAGNDHLVEFNEAHHVVMESDDQGGVDMFGNPTYRGNVYRYNYWHHVGDWQGANPWPAGGQAGIRLDDAISGTLVYGNVFYRAAAGTWPFGGLQIHGGKDNVVDNNLFVDCNVAMSFSPWSEARWLEHIAKPEYAKGIDRDLYAARYASLSRVADQPNRNLLWRNVVYRCREFTARERGVNEMVDNCLLAGTPDGDTPLARLAPSAAELDRCGFTPIPTAEIGLYTDAYRPRLPGQAQ